MHQASADAFLLDAHIVDPEECAKAHGQRHGQVGRRGAHAEDLDHAAAEDIQADRRAIGRDVLPYMADFGLGILLNGLDSELQQVLQTLGNLREVSGSDLDHDRQDDQQRRHKPSDHHRLSYVDAANIERLRCDFQFHSIISYHPNNF